MKVSTIVWLEMQVISNHQIKFAIISILIILRNLSLLTAFESNAV